MELCKVACEKGLTQEGYSLSWLLIVYYMSFSYGHSVYSDLPNAHSQPYEGRRVALL